MSISADGRYVVFCSAAFNLVTGDTNGLADIFLRDLGNGTIQRVSTAADGTHTTGGIDPTISADGRYIAFVSVASTLVPGDATRVAETFVKDLQTGALQPVSTAADGSLGNRAGLGNGSRDAQPQCRWPLRGIPLRVIQPS